VSLTTIHSKQELGLSEPLTIDQILRLQAAQTPNAIAIAATGGKKPLTYRGLVDQVDYVTHFLAKSGLSHQDCVAIVLPNGPEMAIAFLGVTSVAISAPLHPGYREDEFDFYLSELNARALIVQSGCDSPAISVAQKRNIPVIDLSPVVDGVAGLFHLRREPANGSSVVRRAEPTDVALILHTSGTTSRSKMVPLTHANLLASARNIATGLGLTPADRCLNVMPLFHIHGLIGAVLSSLMAGGSVVCASGFDSEEFFSWLKEFHPTWYTAVPTMHQAVLSCAQTNGKTLQCHTLRLIRSCSAALAPDVMRKLEAVFGVPVIEAYGMTEAAHQIASNPLPPHQRKAGSVGLPAGADVSIMDEGGNLLSPGEIGEIVIRGPNVMSSYANNPEASTESFASGWFRTGDQGYLDADGYVLITGRLKEMINRGGEKVSPREVDEVLLEHPGVAEAVSFAVPHATLGEDVAAAIVLRKGASTTESELQRFASVRIAEFKVPRRIVFVDDIPKGPTGKVQRARLAERLGLTASDRAQTDIDSEYTDPRNPIEQKLIEIWSRVLGIKQVGIHDNLFHLGGDSIHATRIIARMRESMGIEFPFGVFFEAPTVAAIAKFIESPGTQVQSRRLSPAEKQQSGPLSHGQEALWFLDQLDPGNPAYNRPMFARLQGALNVSVLERCLNELVERHVVLRVSFAVADDKPIQRMGAHQPLGLPVIDMAHLPEAERESQAAQIAAAETRRPFDLARGPLFRASLLRLAEQLHVLLVTTHHIVFDGWSAEIFLRELAMLYEALSNDRLSPLPELHVQYLDFVRWQRETIQDGLLKDQLAYWRHQLNDAWPIINLPTDRPRVSVRTANGARRSFALTKELSQKLNEISRQERVSLFMTLLASFKTLLHRYSGQEDIIVGTPFAGRNQISTENLVGLFINTLPLRTDLSDDPTFRELLARVRRTCLDAHANQDTPIERIVSELQLKRDTSRPGIYQVLFQLRNYPRQLAHAGDLSIKEYKADSGGSICDLSLAISEEKNGLECCFDYCTDLFDTATIDRMWGHFQSLLQNIAANPDKRLSEFPMLTEAERQQLLVEWNNTKRDYPSDKSIHQLFEEQAERTPDAVAVIFADRQMTYRELNTTANRLSLSLVARKIGRGSFVPFLMDRSIEVPIAMLAIMKAGAAFVPLDIHWPVARIKQILEELNSEVILVNQTTPYGQEVVGGSFLNVNEQTAIDTAGTNVNVAVDSGEPIYTMYTSGSTGKPKGAMIPQRGITNRFSWMNEFFGPAAAGAALQTTHHVYDSAVWQLFWPLINGGTSVIPAPGMEIDAEYLADLIYNNGVTITNFVPSVFNTIVPQLVQDVTLQQKLQSLRTIIVGGEEITPSTTYTFMAQFPTVRVMNLYGPTEASIGCICYEVTGKEGGRIPIGRPISNVHALVLDRNKNLVPVGIAGELYLSGICLGLGYLHDEEKTNAAFVDNPFPQILYSKLYKTGDLVRYLPDGNIQFLGRLDHQVKIRGFRIELGEIETAMRAHPGVREAVVVTHEKGSLARSLVGYIVADQGTAPTAGELRLFLKQKLPEYMVPYSFVFLDTLPLTPNGKIDRKALPEPEERRPESNESYVAPRTPVEEMIAEIWVEVLKVDTVGIHDNFFDLGGHSLLATQVISRARRQFQVELPLRVLFDHLTVAELAQRIEEVRSEEPRIPAPPMVPVSRNRGLPLSFSQQRLWFFDQYEPNSSAYNIPSALRLRGVLNVSALEQSLNEIVKRHESLRTQFVVLEGDPVQVISLSLDHALRVIDLREIPSADREERGRCICEEEARRPFDLSRGPLLRSVLIQMGEDDHILLLTMHHIVSDGWSLEVLYGELSVFYQAYSRSQALPLSPLAIQYADFAVWQKEWLVGEVLERQVSYWRNQLAGIPEVLNLPTDRPRPQVQSYRGARQSLELSQELSHGLKALSRSEGVTLFMTLLAAFQTLLYRYTSQEDIVVGSAIANRNCSEIEGLIGFFVNTLVLRTTFRNNPTFRELLGQVKETALQAYAHQDLPFEKLVEELKPTRNLSYSPLVQVMFILHNTPSHVCELEDLTLSQIELDNKTAKLDLSLALTEYSDGIRGFLEYNTDLFDAATIDLLAGHFRTLLEGLVADPCRSIVDLPILTQAERHQLLVQWDDTTRDYPRDKCLHQMFEEQVETSRDAVAVIFEEQQLTYKELNQRANRVAHDLQKRGVTVETMVGIFAERSLEMIVGMLGILKVGGAYVPLDPYYPKERLAFMLEDTHAPVLLTQKRLVESLPAFDGQIVCLDDVGGTANDSTSNIESGATADNLAYVIYTSGSTGKPKAVQVLHHAVVNLLSHMRAALDLTDQDHLLSLANICFDMSVPELFLPLCMGGRVIVASADNGVDGGQIGELIAGSGTTVMQATPATWDLLLQAGWKGAAHLKLISGGEALQSELAEQLVARASSAWNLYGPTETTVWSSAAKLHVEAGEANICVGRPIANTQIYILDDQLEPVPIGVPGHLHIGGAGVARGYLNRPDLTAEKFIPDPFTREPGARLYRTGDLARYLSSGNIDLLGRLDHQVKIRGFRIELGEVESVLGQHPAVRGTVVVARGDTPGDKNLVAYIVPKQRPAPTSSDLRNFAKQKLPEWMVPSAFVVLDALPLTSNRKVDRSALPAPDQSRPELEQCFIAPRTPVEEIMAEIWVEVLKLNTIGIHDNFFDLGGHSLLATQVISRARRQFQVELPLRVLFEHPTVMELAQRVEEARSAQIRSSDVGPRGMEQILADLNSLSDEEAQSLLAREIRDEPA
jgi:amino acid adenylation domain-containing protein